jgi:integrative and conjugative element protein (TIGR02256 family)
MQTVAMFLGKEGSVVKIDTSPLAIMKKYRQLEENDKEAGGLLLGRMIENSNDIIVDEISELGPNDRRSRFSFFRSKSIQKIVNMRWFKSRRTQNYLGEWHTHPEPYPSPSAQDLRDWRNILNKGVFEQEFLIFVIVGQVTISAWEFRKGDIVPCQLRPADRCGGKWS